MFNVVFDDVVYSVDFSYKRDEGITFCDISTQGHIYMGAAICHPKDNFVKNIGRKVALEDALKAGPFTKTERRQFWHNYFATRNGKYE